MSEDFFALPPFKAQEALQMLERQLRDMRGMALREGVWEWQGKPVVRLSLTPDGAAIASRLARRPLARPDWDDRRLGNAAEVRKFIETVGSRLAGWRDDD